MKGKALIGLAFAFAILIASSFINLAYAQSLVKGSWIETARGGDAIWKKDSYYYYQTFDDDKDGWILFNYTKSFDFQLWTQTVNDVPGHIDSCFSGDLYHVRDYIIFNPSMNWSITFRFSVRFGMMFWLPTAGVTMCIYNNTEPAPDYWPGANYDYAFNFGKGANDGNYYIWIWNNGTSIKFRVSFKKGDIFVGESVCTYTLSFNVPAEFFLDAHVKLKIWKYGASGQITGKVVYEEVFVGGPISEPENISPLPSWIQKATEFIISLFYMLCNIVIGIAPYAGIGLAIWIISGAVTAAETGEFSAMWEPFITIYSVFTGILNLIVKVVKTIGDWIMRFLTWIGLVGVAA